jgi:UDPglucose 6-dehydrogenase
VGTKRRELRLTVLGTGYLGLSHAVSMAALGFEVLGVDTDASRIDALNRAEVPIFEPGLQALLRRGLDSGRLRFTTAYSEAAAFGNVHFVCVGTPQRTDTGGADLSQLNACIAMLAPLLVSPCLVVGKCTVPVGTARALSEVLARLAPAGNAVELAWNPEFLREGHALEDTLHPDRIVAGVRSASAEALLRRVYAKQVAEGTPFFVTDFATAELVKSAANAFLATKISFANAMSELSDAVGGDVITLAEILAADPRIGASHLVPGLGFGGACLPKDIRAFLVRATELGMSETLSFLAEIDAINLRCRARMIELVQKILGGSLVGRAISILGVSFKPDSDDIRNSPALAVAEAACDQGARVTVYDPVAMEKAREVCPRLGCAASLLEAVHDAEVILLLTEWPEFRTADPEILAKEVGARNIVDGRNALDSRLWRAAGWNYYALGRPNLGAVS